MGDNSGTLLTIITPTYNRADCLENCYRSLLRQSTGGFEWILVDDGSTDNTEEVVASFSGTPFPFYFIKKENGGKHTALNAAHPYIHGRYVLILDSDDTLTEDAVSQTLGAWSEWEGQSEVGIVTLLKGADKDHPNCYVADENKPVDISSYPRICPVSGDACEVIRADLFLRYPFPVFPGERFLSEGVLWNRVGLTHTCVYVNKVIYICDYREGGLTKSGRAMRIRNPRGGMCAANLNMARKNSFKKRIKNGLLFVCYGCFAHESFMNQLRLANYPCLTAACVPAGYLLYRIWRHKYW